jgi:hypothetical protein
MKLIPLYIVFFSVDRLTILSLSRLYSVDLFLCDIGRHSFVILLRDRYDFPVTSHMLHFRLIRARPRESDPMSMR